jgi:hypothetical protein
MAGPSFGALVSGNPPLSVRDDARHGRLRRQEKRSPFVLVVLLSRWWCSTVAPLVPEPKDETPTCHKMGPWTPDGMAYADTTAENVCSSEARCGW